MLQSTITAALFGLAVGDALGVPYEFRSRAAMSADPATDMTGYGTHGQPAGTFSDDSSLAFCLAESLCRGYNLSDLALRMTSWYESGYWTAHGEVFDVGNATRRAIHRLQGGCSPLESGGEGEDDNGNGSLMRILPLLFYIKDLPAKERYRLTREVSGLTHRHIRSVVSCFYYLEFARLLAGGREKAAAYAELREWVPSFLEGQGVPAAELSHFDRLFKQDIIGLDESVISGSGYVVHTLEASAWCLLHSSDYSSAVLRAVNLGEDTDTTAAVTGGLAGLYYGMGSIPAGWVEVLARRDEIRELAGRLAGSVS